MSTGSRAEEKRREEKKEVTYLGSHSATSLKEYSNRSVRAQNLDQDPDILPNASSSAPHKKTVLKCVKSEKEKEGEGEGKDVVIKGCFTLKNKIGRRRMVDDLKKNQPKRNEKTST